MHRAVEHATYIFLIRHSLEKSHLAIFVPEKREGWTEWQEQKHCSPASHLSSGSSLWSDNCAEGGEEKEEKGRGR